MPNQSPGSNFWGVVALLVFVTMAFLGVGWILYVLISPKESLFSKLLCAGVIFLLWKIIRTDRQIRQGLRTGPNYAEYFLIWFCYSAVLWFAGIFVISFFLEFSELAKTEEFLTPSNMIIWAIIVFAGVGVMSRVLCKSSWVILPVVV